MYQLKIGKNHFGNNIALVTIGAKVGELSVGLSYHHYTATCFVLTIFIVYPGVTSLTSMFK